jgi:hypothetical protein
MTETRFTRKALYEKVWASPLKRVAAEHGISDVGLSKICRRYNIPIPGRGYWRKKEFGHALVRPPLPDPERGDEITFTGHSRSQPSSSVPAVELVKPSRLHPLAAKTANLLERAPLSWKRLVEPLPGGLNVKVSKEGRPRALKIMTTLIATLERAGARVEATSRPSRWSDVPPRVATVVTIDSERIDIELSEPSKDRMQLELPYGLQVSQRAWKDTPTRALEERILDFAIAIFQAIPLARANRLKAEEDERARRAAQEEAERRRRAAELEQRRRNMLRRELHLLWFADATREYIRQVKSRNPDPDEVLARWLEWAAGRADELDPRRAIAGDRFADLFNTDIQATVTSAV